MPILTGRPLDFPSFRARGFLLSTLLLLASPRVRAEGTVAYKYADYREAGGRITDADGADDLTTLSVVATNVLLHDEILARLGAS